MNYKYSIRNEDFKNSYNFKSDWNEDIDYVAENAAKDFFNNHDGWESSWPIDFYLFTEDGKLLGKYNVELEYDPTFCATHKD